MTDRFHNRTEAGRRLAAELKDYAGRRDAVVLGLPRGGVPVAFEVARALGAPLDVLMVRKLGVPRQEELAFGAIAAGGVNIFDEEFLSRLRLTDERLEQIIEAEQRELARRERLYREGRPPLDVAGRTVIVVDDGLATGASAFAAVSALKMQRPAEIVVAAPVAAEEALAVFEGLPGVACVAVLRPARFECVGEFYRDFTQTSDEEVCRLLKRAREFPRETGAAAGPSAE